jgi:hypothetical protein
MSKIYVDSIASKTGAADALTIDSSGRILRSVIPSVFAQGGSATTITINNSDRLGATADGTSAFVTDGTSGSHIEGGIEYNSSTGEFTVPVTGLYAYYGQYYCSSANATARIGVYINNTQRTLGHDGYLSGTVQVSGIIKLSAGDKLDFRQVSGGDLSVYQGPNHTYAYIYLIG